MDTDYQRRNRLVKIRSAAKQLPFAAFLWCRCDFTGWLNPDSEVAAAISVGSTGHWPVPSGDPPLGTGKAPGIFRASVFSASVRSLPSGQWPDGTGGSPVLPIPISEFGLNIVAPK